MRDIDAGVTRAWASVAGDGGASGVAALGSANVDSPKQLTFRQIAWCAENLRSNLSAVFIPG